jgi:hypothetical protein
MTFVFIKLVFVARLYLLMIIYYSFKKLILSLLQIDIINNIKNINR